MQAARMRSGLMLAMLLVAGSAPAANAQFAYLETDDLRLIYEEVTLSYLAPHVARCFENSMACHRRFFDYEPGEPVTVILNDLADYGNGGASATPLNAMMISVAPVSTVFETYPVNERINTMMHHELVHITALDRASRRDGFFRSLFRGKVRETDEHPESIIYSYLTIPRNAAPRWYHEGIAVFMETWMAGGVGRALGAYDEMVFRTMVRDGRHFYTPLGLESEGTKIDFQVGVNSYLYGARFMSYLAFRFSPEALIEWVSRTDGSRTYFATQFERVFGLPLGEAWSEWIAWEHDFQRGNLEAIRRYPTTPYRALSGQGLGSMSRAHLDPGTSTLYAAVNYPGEVAHIAVISTRDGRIEKLMDVKGAALYFVTSVARDVEGRTLFYTTDNNEWRDLRAIDLVTGRSRTLMEDARVGDLAFNRQDRSLWGIRHFNGISTLVRMPAPYSEWNQIHSWPYGQAMFDLDISPDGRRLSASFGEVNGRQSLRLYDIAALAGGDTTSSVLHEFGVAVPEGFSFAPDGRYLYGSSYYTGVSNIFRYDLDAGAMDIVTNCETGFFRPVALGGDSLVVFRYTADGFVPGVVDARPLEDVSAIDFLGQQVVEAHEVVKQWMAPSPRTVDLDARVRKRGDYVALSHLRLVNLYPIVEGYKEFPAYGVRVNIADPLSLHAFGIAASYTPNGRVAADERTHLRFGYERYDWDVTFKHNGADFYDLFGPTKRSRKGSSLGVGHRRSLLYDGPRKLELSLRATGHWGLERLPDYQNVRASSTELATASARLGYQNLRASLGAVDYEKGHAWQLVGATTWVDHRFYPNAVATLDAGAPLPLRHHSLWLRGAAGYSPGDRDEPSANFYFGGFGNNWVDHSHPKQYRSYHSFPGTELNAIAGTNFTRMMVDWNLQPLRFRRWGTTSLHATWARMSLFATGIVTNFDGAADRRKVGNLGSQVDIRMVLLSHLDLTLSCGYALAFERQRRPADEFMVSLKVL